MHTRPITGPIGPFAEPGTGRQVHASLHGTVTFQCAGDPDQMLPGLTAALLQSATRVVAQKLASSELAVPTLAQSLPHFLQEIAMQSGAQTMGANITGLQAVANVEHVMPVAQQHVGPLPPDPHTQMQNRMRELAAQQAHDVNPLNKEYEVQVNIGGFKLKGNTDEGFDAKGLKGQVEDKVKSTLVWWGIGCAIVAVVLVGLAILAWYIYREVKQGSAGPKAAATSSADAKPRAWDGKSTLTCGATDNIKVANVKANLAKGPAVQAQSGCRLELVNVEITAPIGISAIGNAVVVMKNGSVTAKDAAAKAVGSATITFQGTKVTGKKEAVGANAKVEGP